MADPMKRKKIYSPTVAVNTLNGRGAGHKAFRGPSIEPPAPKRPRSFYSDSRLVPPLPPHDDIAEVDRDASSLLGSQEGVSHDSRSVIFRGFGAMEESAKYNEGRSNRRRRRGSAESRRLPSIESGRDEIVDDFDELGEPRASTLWQRSKNQSSSAATSSTPRVVDSADTYILQPRHSRPSHGLQMSRINRKRPSHDSDNEDELNTSLNGFARKRNPPSVSQRADLARTRWANPKTPGLDAITISVPISSAVCTPNHRYVADLSSDGEGTAKREKNCYLRSQEGIPEQLCAFDENGIRLEEYSWLKITKKLAKLHHHPESNLLKVSQSLDPTAKIGAKMVLKLFEPAHAAQVVAWTKQVLRSADVREETCDKLIQTYDTTLGEVSRGITNSPKEASSVRNPGEGSKQDGSRIASVQEPPASPVVRKVRSQGRLKDLMQLSSQATPPRQATTPGKAPSLPQRSLRSGQSGGNAHVSPEPPTPAVHRWSEQHQGSLLMESCEWPLQFRRTTVDKDDIPRLDEGQCLNDNLIGFGLRYLFDEFSTRHPDLNKRVYLHNSFFYEKLKSGKGRSINYEGVKSWTSKVDLLAYDYIIVPVNECYHWWVAIICNPGRLDPDAPKARGNGDDASSTATERNQDVTDAIPPGLEMTDAVDKRSPHESPTEELSQLAIDSPREPANTKPDVGANDQHGEVLDLIADDVTVVGDLSPKTGKGAKHGKKHSGPPPRKISLENTKIITLDSLGASHSPAVTALKQYLIAEFADKRNKIITDVPAQLGMKAVNIPEQNNFCDCGVYLLGYIQEFVRNPDRFVHTLLRKEVPDWKFDPSQLRELWRETIFFVHKKQQSKKRGADESKLADAAHSSQAANGVPGKIPNEGAVARIRSRPGSVSARPSPSQSRVTSPKPEKDVAIETAISPTSQSRMEIVPDSDSEMAPHPASDPVREASPHHTSPNGKIQAPPDESHQEGSGDEVLLVQARDEVSRPVKKMKPSKRPEVRDILDEEPKFISKLPSSSPPPRQQSPDRVEELTPKAFYGNDKPKASRPSPTTTTATKLAPDPTRPPAVASSPISIPVKRYKKPTEPRGVILGPSPYFVVSDIPVVQKAELVRRAEHIDLTEDETMRS
ncbi:hypothetical protein B0T19DRAFT_157633 [Cercophora scortea]|uniref:Ubiquitin-like protease family profile domain-containing protein n=1 Tax=Cercophora scortea TaxID=314031 RepID=A0AAE0ILJ4_9PEZI|nr:hypothetical protein B0T19DRAFT_157633 [Cercophora scortea]